jgi:hypothetical protein
MGTTAIQEWQRGVVAIGACNPNLSDSELDGSGFIVDLQSGLVVTCAHVVLSIYKGHLSSPSSKLDPGGAAPNAGLAIGVGIGEKITWVCRAELRYISRPPQNYPGPAPPNHWVVKDDGKDLDLAVLQLVAPNGSALQTSAQVLAWHGKNACALSLGVPPSMPQSVPLSDGAELVMLGYGQSHSGKGDEQTSTTMRGHFAGCYSSNGQMSGDWLKVDVRILGGHSGGPVVNRVGEVVGWADFSSASLGQLRPIVSLVSALTWVLQQPCCNTPAGAQRDVSGGLRVALQGAIAPGTFELGGEELKRCRDAARAAATSAAAAAASEMAAATSAENAHLEEQSALAHALFSARARDLAASEASAAAEHAAGAGVCASQARGAAASAESSAAQAATTAVSRGRRVGCHSRANLRDHPSRRLRWPSQ